MGNKKILLVEDNPNDVELTKRALQKAHTNSELIIAGDGIEAVKYFFGEHDNNGCLIEDLPALVLLDLNLPRFNGFEVLRPLSV